MSQLVSTVQEVSLEQSSADHDHYQSTSANKPAKPLVRPERAQPSEKGSNGPKLSSRKNRKVYQCTDCETIYHSWTGQCDECEAWATITELPTGAVARTHNASIDLTTRDGSPTPKLTSLAEIDWEVGLPTPTGVDEVDRVLGGGLTAGSATLLAGEPGIGKSTLTLQVAASVAKSGASVVLVTGEEGPQQVAGRAARIGKIPPSLFFVDEVSVGVIVDTMRAERPQLVIVDSIQTLVDSNVAQPPGSLQQIRASANALIQAAKTFGVSLIMIGHVTKEGSVAGPKVLEHAVDTVITFEGDKQSQLRFLRATKNRFGATSETGIFDMTSSGMVAVQDPSERCLQDRQLGVPGSVVAPCLSGRRPVLVEVQALAAKRDDNHGALAVQGIDRGRVSLVLAVLSARAGYGYLKADLFLSVAGGLKVAEPAADLAVLLALSSAIDDEPIAPTVVACGEIGLGGEIRNVGDIELRLQEAHRMGFRAAVVPKAVTKGPSGLELVSVATVNEALNRVPRAPAVAWR